MLKTRFWSVIKESVYLWQFLLVIIIWGQISLISILLTLQIHQFVWIVVVDQLQFSELNRLNFRLKNKTKV